MLAAAQEVLPDGRTRNALDELMLFLAVMVVNDRLRHGQHFTTTRDGILILPLPDVLPEARRYARETDSQQVLLREDAYRGLVAEAAKQRNPYVLETSRPGDFDPPGNGGRRRRRGVLIDRIVLEQRLGIEADTWLHPKVESPDIRARGRPER